MNIRNALRRVLSPAVKQQPSIEQTVNQVYNRTGKQIIEGLSKPTASTGKPIEELHGAAKRIAQMSNIGGGSKATGGKGIDGGLDTLTKHAQARTAKTMIESAKRNRIGKK